MSTYSSAQPVPIHPNLYINTYMYIHTYIHTYISTFISPSSSTSDNPGGGWTAESERVQKITHRPVGPATISSTQAGQACSAYGRTGKGISPLLARHQSTSLPVCWSACRLSLVACRLCCQCDKWHVLLPPVPPPSPLLCSSLPLWAAAVSGPDPGRASPGYGFVQLCPDQVTTGHACRWALAIQHHAANTSGCDRYYRCPFRRHQRSSLVCLCACVHARMRALDRSEAGAASR